MEQNRQLPPELLFHLCPQYHSAGDQRTRHGWKAKDMGMKVSSDDADNAIIDSIPAQYVKDGKVDPTILRTVLANLGNDAGRYEGIHIALAFDHASGIHRRWRRGVTNQEVEKRIPETQRQGKDPVCRSWRLRLPEGRRGHGRRNSVLV